MIRRVRKKRKLNAEINVVPYIDVMMVLLVIFMITAPMLTQGVDVQLPKAGSDPVDTQDNEPLIVTVDKEGRYYIDVGGDPLKAISGEVVEERVAKVLSSNPKKLLLVRGDKGVDYDHVIQLMTLLQQAGAESVGLVTE
ncbi:protein TolR [Amphritea sp. 2_MG-2023]|uniref:protein TolR n=1 Tax=Amphritea TaxID=515417 RepID=UPI001C076CBC|nr:MULTISPECIES: protein TolR [Amphritea]MBU2966461.1 protein TolR [Amphritea atlantica]MDO6417680.1 protein TolR [Amphritea sp. 2_MG-2023]MDX2422541.1 protein TolR [Amphritea sp.]